MNEVIKKITQFFILLLGVCSITFGIHLFILKTIGFSLFDNKIIGAYILNLFFATFVYGIILFLSKTHENILGFVFMTSSLIKFGLFFLFFYPAYNADDNMSRVEFLTFFIPYAICLAIETTYLIKHLNNKL